MCVIIFANIWAVCYQNRLKNYSNMEKDIRNHVLAAIIFISALIIATGIIIVFLARSLASSIKQPLGKLVDVVRALGRKDSPHTVCFFFI